MLHGNRNVFEFNSSICVNAISSQQKKFTDWLKKKFYQNRRLQKKFTDWLKKKFYQNRRYSAIFILLEETEETENDA
jgi:hypothetical protein